MAKIGVVTVSDRAFQGKYEDQGGPEILSYLRENVTSNWEPIIRLVPDEVDQIESTIKDLCDKQQCCLVITTGGTGPMPRDVTPDATLALATRELPGFGERMRSVSAQTVPTAILSRQVAVIRNETLVVNLPGKPQAIRVCLDAVMPAIPPCIVHIGGPRLEIKTEVAKKAMSMCC